LRFGLVIQIFFLEDMRLRKRLGFEICPSLVHTDRNLATTITGTFFRTTPWADMPPKVSRT